MSSFAFLATSSQRGHPSAIVPFSDASPLAKQTFKPQGLSHRSSVGLGVAATLAAASSLAPKTKKSNQRLKRGITVARISHQHATGAKPKVLVLGSGWGALGFIQGLTEEEAQMYDITLVSPRNFFLYTPLLPACTMGSVEERSITLPMRKVLAGKGKFIEAQAEHIDIVNKKVTCSRAEGPKNRVDIDYDRFPKGDVDGKLSFDLDYDILVYGVGAKSNDFGIPGVKEHTFSFKELSDARKVRERIHEVLEQASLPLSTPEKVEELLSFVVVGGGPSGVEVAADLLDFVVEEAQELYPELVDKVKVTIVSIESQLLSTYSDTISKKSVEVFEEKGITVMRSHRVTGFTPDAVNLVRMSDGKELSLKYGCAVWCAGITEIPLSKQLRDSLREVSPGVQANARGITTDERLQVRGSHGSIYALGDAATVDLDRAMPRAQELFQAADANNNGELSMQELRELFKAASTQYPYFQEYANYLEEHEKDSEGRAETKAAVLDKMFDGAVGRDDGALNFFGELIPQRVETQRLKKNPEQISKQLKEVDVNQNDELDFQEFTELLRGIEGNLRGFPPTAQVAQQQGQYLARRFAEGQVAVDEESYKQVAKAGETFRYLHKGSLVFLGQGVAGMDVPLAGTFTGQPIGVAWKAFETMNQFSWKNRALVALDWMRTQVWGRDSSRLGR